MRVRIVWVLGGSVRLSRWVSRVCFVIGGCARAHFLALFLTIEFFDVDLMRVLV